MGLLTRQTLLRVMPSAQSLNQAGKAALFAAILRFSKFVFEEATQADEQVSYKRRITRDTFVAHAQPTAHILCVAAHSVHVRPVVLCTRILCLSSAALRVP